MKIFQCETTNAEKIFNELHAKSLQDSLDVRTAERDLLKETLSNILFVINEDKDVGYFICEEAEHVIEEARKLL